MEAHAKTLGLTFITYSDTTGVQLEVSPTDDHRVLRVTRPVRRGTQRFWTTHKKAAHVLRAISRVRCLQQARQTRLDSEEVDNVDVDAPSHRVFTKRYNNLDDDDKKLLTIYQGGAVSTSTRRQCTPLQVRWSPTPLFPAPVAVLPRVQPRPAQC